MSLADSVNSWLGKAGDAGVFEGKAKWGLYLPPVFVITVFFIIPVALVGVTSFYPRFSGVSEIGFTLQFYGDAMNPSYVSSLWRSIWYGVVTMIASLILAYPVVYAAVKIFDDYEILILLFSVLPFWVMYLIRMFGWISILKDGGLIDNLVTLTGLNIEATILYSAPAVIIGLIFSWYPLMVFPLYASIKSLDDSLLEASKDLGANSFRTFYRVTIPQTKSGILAGSILVFVPSFGSYVTPILLGGTNSSQMIANIIGRQFRESFNWPLGSSLAMLMMIIVVACLFIVQQYATVVEVNEQ